MPDATPDRHRLAPRSHARFRAVVPAMSPVAPRPLWSVMIPTFNCADLLRESLASVLAQDPGAEHMQIEVVDDCSTKDDPEPVVTQLGAGRVEFYRQPRNLGHSANFNTCLQRSRGRLVHLLHGDDWVGHGFYERMQRPFADFPGAGAAFCRHTITNPDKSPQRISPLEREDPGVLQDWLQLIAAELRLQPPSMVVRREVYESLGGFDTRMASCGEDWEMWVRIAASYDVAYEPTPLAFYRDNSESLTKRSIQSGQNIRDVRRATAITRSYLPRHARAANRRASISWASWATDWARQLVERGDYRSAAVQLREALLCSRSPRTLRSAARIVHLLVRREFARKQRSQAANEVSR